MKWKKRQQQIEEMRRRHGRDRSLTRTFPDLKVEQRTAPCSNDMAKISYAAPKEGTSDHGLIVDTLHKQGPMVLSKTELPWAGGKKP